jgi:DNA-binding MarR family transcriptional regulator
MYSRNHLCAIQGGGEKSVAGRVDYTHEKMYMQIMADPEPLVQLPCACASMRRATRAVTRLYDRELRETGLRSTQFTLLQALQIASKLTQGELGDLLSIDTTTLTRSLRPLLDAGWVKSERGKDRRERYLQLTTSGVRKYQDALSAWRRAQNRLKKSVGRNWDELEQDLRRITGTVT